MSTVSIKTVLFFATLSLVIWLILGSNEKRREYDEEKVIEEMLEQEKRDEMPESRGMHHHCLLVIYSKNTMLDI